MNTMAAERHVRYGERYFSLNTIYLIYDFLDFALSDLYIHATSVFINTMH